MSHNIGSHNIQAGNSLAPLPLLRLYYNDRRALTVSPEEYSALENAARRLFVIPVEQALILSTEVPEFGNERLEIDPDMWNLIKPQINAIWIRFGESRVSRMTIIAHLSNYQKLPLVVNASDTMESLRVMVKNNREIACKFDPHPLFKGAVQPPERTVSECGMKENDIVYWVDDSGPSIRIFIKTTRGTTRTLGVKASWRVEHLKAVLEFMEGVKPCEQRLIFSGKQLEDSMTLARYNIPHDSTIHIVLRLRGGKPVIYLFSPNPVDASVSLSLVPSWSFSALYPVTKIQDEQDGRQLISWNVLVNPDGTLKDKDSGSEVSYLYWEAKTNPIQKIISPPHSRPGSPSGVIDASGMQEIFDPAYPIITSANSVVLAIADVPSYLDKSLLELGFHTEARTSFITYWLPDLLHHKYIALRFLPQYTYEAAAPLAVEPVPLEIVRIFMLWRGVLPREVEEENNWSEAQRRMEEMDIEEWRDVVGIKHSTSKEGLRVLEWGGMEVK